MRHILLTTIIIAAFAFTAIVVWGASPASPQYYQENLLIDGVARYPFPSFRWDQNYKSSPDSQHVVFIVTENHLHDISSHHLLSWPITATEPITLDSSFDYALSSYHISSDSSHVIYTRVTLEYSRLYRQAITGGEPELLWDGDIRDFRILSDDTILVSTDNPTAGLWKISADGSEIQQVSPYSLLIKLISPDERYLVTYRDTTTTTIDLIDLQEGSSTTFAGEYKFPDFITQDSRHLVAYGGDSSRFDSIYVTRLDQPEWVWILDIPTDISLNQIIITPDNKSIIYVLNYSTSRSQENGIYAVDMDGQNHRTVVSQTYAGDLFLITDITEDGKTIIYTVNTWYYADYFTLFALDIESNVTRQLTPPKYVGVISQAQLTPDEKEVVFAADYDAQQYYTQLYVVPIEGGDLRSVTNYESSQTTRTPFNIMNANELLFSNYYGVYHTSRLGNVSQMVSEGNRLARLDQMQNGDFMLWRTYKQYVSTLGHTLTHLQPVRSYHEWGDHFADGSMLSAENDLTVQSSELGLLLSEDDSWVQTTTEDFAQGTFDNTQAISGTVQLIDVTTMGLYTSTVFDAAERVDWLVQSWTQQASFVESNVITYRTGDVPVPDETWSEWIKPRGSQIYFDCVHPLDTEDAQAHCTSTLPGIPSARYLQYQVVFNPKSQRNTTIPLHDLTIHYGQHLLTGSAESQLVAPNDLDQWSQLIYTATVPTGTTLRVDLVSADGNPILTNVAPNADLSTVDIQSYPAVKLRAMMTSTDPSLSPEIEFWGLRWLFSERHTIYLPLAIR